MVQSGWVLLSNAVENGDLSATGVGGWAWGVWYVVTLVIPSLNKY